MKWIHFYFVKEINASILQGRSMLQYFHTLSRHVHMVSGFSPTITFTL